MTEDEINRLQNSEMFYKKIVMDLLTGKAWVEDYGFDGEKTINIDYDAHIRLNKNGEVEKLIVGSRTLKK